MLQLQTGAEPYSQKYKGIWLCLAILTRALSGNYVNFGVFDLYGDPALKVRCPTLLAIRFDPAKPNFRFNSDHTKNG